MSKLLEFFKSKNLERRFSRLGEGRKLGDRSERDEGSQIRPVEIQESMNVQIDRPAVYSSAASAAADAAMERINQQNKRPDRSMRNEIKRELELARKAEQEATALKNQFTTKVTTQEKPASLSRVLFWCPSLFGDSVVGTREEVDRAIDDYLESESSSDLPEAAALTVIRHLELTKPPTLPDVPISEQPTASEWREKRKQNFARILSNLIENPQNPTFRRLRVRNQLVSDLLSIKGANLFFKVCGFREQSLPARKTAEPDDQEPKSEPELEPFLVISEEDASNSVHLQRMLDLLNSAQPILAELHRDTKVYMISGSFSPMPSKEQLPDEYFCLSREEVKRVMEQYQRTIEESGMLLTKAMRERLRIQEVRLFRYVLIRVRLPGNLIIQGTFYASDTVLSVRTWISECLAIPSTEYQLWAPPGTVSATRSNAPPAARRELNTETATLAECGLAPCTLLSLSIPDSHSGASSPEPRSNSPPHKPLLRPDLLANLSQL
ncbi:UBX domain-containing protein 6 [Fasciolopsis buskii]|uniref:UBX domain-containing protein 6 n=1 Tax=Fasciolopsis buskii TaxID=27845 RepID=A0A8E0RVP2_9TREM|nr:UBX domain-containing protein 6 [Fasciolopsis buski]